MEDKGVLKFGNLVSCGDYIVIIKINIFIKIILEERELLEKLVNIKGECIGKGGKEGFLGNWFN